MQAEKEAVTMDQIKIGKFIALCRKEKGLTQAQSFLSAKLRREKKPFLLSWGEQTMG